MQSCIEVIYLLNMKEKRKNDNLICFRLKWIGTKPANPLGLLLATIQFHKSKVNIDWVEKIYAH